MRKIFSIFLISYCTLFAVTNVSGPISTDVTWMAIGDSTYRIIGDITIEYDAILTIEPGVKVHFAGAYRILVNGTLNALGTVTDSIIFRHEIPGQRHHSIDFESTSTQSIMQYCLITDGTAGEGQGGGIFISNSSPIIRHCSIVNNLAYWGGGIFIVRSSQAIIEKNIIAHNTADNLGGGIGCDGGYSSNINEPRINNNLIYNNHCTFGGGGINFWSYTTAVLNNNLVYGNSSNSGGGGLRIQSGENNIIIRNSIFRDNTAADGKEEIDEGDYAGNISVEYSNILNGYEGVGNIDADPIFKDPSNGDFRFEANSPLVDAGTNTDALSDDFDSNTRPFDGNRDGIAIVDIGPFEYINTPPFISSTPIDSVHEEESYMYQVTAVDPDVNDKLTFSLKEAPAFLSIDSVTGEITGTPLNEDVGLHNIMVSVNDLNNTEGTQSYTLEVIQVNFPPMITELPVWTFNEDDSLIISITSLYEYVEDPDHPDSLLVFYFEAGSFVSVYQDSINIVLKTPAHWYGQDTLVMFVSNDKLTNSAELTVIVKPVNDIPFFVSLPDTIQFMNTSDTTLLMQQYADDYDLPNDSLRWRFSVSNDSLLLQFDWITTELTLSAPGFVGIVTLRCMITDDSSATAIDSFYVKITPDPTSIEDLTELIPLQYSLGQNYPNPFNPLTNIKFAMPKAGDVKIEIYNILGQKVITLWDGFKPAGYHIVQFDASNLSSGLYFYSMQSREFRKVKKLILMR